ncbi:Nucleotide-binding universal stress protein, UspA family [Agromyces flavus]|uniref:Nucleotide-binding universal stress protein, UspA family n=2 Tax=Agromyces flavus TaxID=589382 RepID=A0A1H1XIR9_9MICO|nr:Nucleotide-binding universal stress protein, UspA family [Agromyces flavus]
MLACMTIVVGADGSVASRAALTWAIDRARSVGDDLALVTVVDDGWGSVGESALAELKRTTEERAGRELEFARKLAAGVDVRGALALGSPMLALAEAGRDADLIAVGTHKVGYFHGHALGSRSLQLAAVSGVPSAVVPVTSWRGRSGVAVGVADGVDSDDAVRFAAQEARRLGEPLVLLRAAGGEPDASSAGDRAASLAAAVHPGIQIEVRSTADPASGALIGVSRRAVLTVTGRRVPSRGFLPLGRTNTDLLMNLAGPVVVVPHTSVEAVVVGWTAA